MDKDQSAIDFATKVAYDEALRRLSAQRESLSELRTRAGALLSAVAIATSFFGAVAAPQSTSGLPSRFYLPVALFIVASGLCMVVLLPIVVPLRLPFRLPFLLPTRRWFEGIDPCAFLNAFDPASTASHVHRDLTAEIMEGQENNRRWLDLLFWFFLFAAIALTAELVAWIWVVERLPDLFNT